MEALKKIKKLKKPLDKLKKMCYNKHIRNGDELQKKLEGRNLIARKRSYMTNREFLNTIINANISDEVTAQAQDLLAKLDARNAKRAATPSKTAVANEPIKAKIVELLSNATELMTAPQVGEAVGVSTQKASALLRQMVEVGTITSEEVKIPKKGKMKGYTLADKG